MTGLLIFAAACLTWGLGAAAVIAAADMDGTARRLLDHLHHGGTRV